MQMMGLGRARRCGSEWAWRARSGDGAGRWFLSRALENYVLFHHLRLVLSLVKVESGKLFGKFNYGRFQNKVRF